MPIEERPLPSLSDRNNERSVYGLVTASVLNVRSGPGTSYAKIGELLRGEQVQILVRERDGTRS
jgi:N-acetylmuramoyl-L-alanine amidase